MPPKATQQLLGHFYFYGALHVESRFIEDVTQRGIEFYFFYFLFCETFPSFAHV